MRKLGFVIVEIGMCQLIYCRIYCIQFCQLLESEWDKNMQKLITILISFTVYYIGAVNRLINIFRVSLLHMRHVVTAVTTIHFA